MTQNYKAYIADEVAKMKASGATYHSDPQVRAWASTQGIKLDAAPVKKVKSSESRAGQVAFGAAYLFIPLIGAALASFVILAEASDGIRMIGGAVGGGVAGLMVMGLKSLVFRSS